MCRRYGGHNHLDLKQEVILIVLEIPEEKQRMIIENNYLLPYALQIIRFQVSTTKWTKYRKKYGNRENITPFSEIKLPSEKFSIAEQEEHWDGIEPETIIEKIKLRIRMQSVFRR